MKVIENKKEFTRRNRHKDPCGRCGINRTSFTCKECGKFICINCVIVTVIAGKWSFYCSYSCAPYRVDEYKRHYAEVTKEGKLRRIK